MTVHLLTGHVGDQLLSLDPESVQCVVTSPPYYGLRDYGLQPSAWPAVEFVPMAGLPAITVPAMDACLGLEPDPWAFVGHMVEVFRGVRRVLRKDGVLWLNLGDSYAGSWGAEGRSGTHGNRAHNLSTYNLGRNAGGMAARSTTKRCAGGLKPKDLIGMPWRVAFALQADGWWLRSDCIWSKPNPMPCSVKDRPAVSHEYLFMLTQSRRYLYRADAVMEAAARDDRPGLHEYRDANGRRARENNSKHPGGWASGTGCAHDELIGRYVPVGTGVGFGHGFDAIAKPRAKREHTFARTTNGGVAPGNPPQHRADREPVEYSGLRRNRRTVWTIPTQACRDAHFATFPERLVEPCILAGSNPGDMVLDPFSGTATTGAVALRLGRRYVGIEASAEYQRLAEKRLRGAQMPLPLEGAA